MIDKFIPEYWIDVDLYINELIQNINNENKKIDESLSLINVEDRSFYIEQDITEAYKPNYQKKKNERKQKINIYDEIQDYHFIMIEGGMGTGKSKLLREITNQLSKPENYIKYKLIPIRINYIDFSNNYNGDIDELVNDTIKSYNKDSLSDCNYLILLDGFDEKRVSKEEKLDCLNNLKMAVDNSSHYRILLTSRFLSGVFEGEDEISSIRRLELSPLSLNKTIKFIEKICSSINLSNRIYEDLKNSMLMKELPRSPIAAILLAELIKDSSIDLPSNMTELYTKYLELMLGRWDVEKGLETQKEFQVAERIIMELAEYYIDNNVYYLTYDETKDYFNRYIDSRNFNFGAETLLKKILDRSNILKYDENLNNVYFSHRTFAEYYYAKKKKNNEQLQINNKVFDLYWMNIYFFYIGLLEDCPELLEKIVKVEPKDKPQRWLKIVNLSNFFLAGYSTPYETIEENLHLPIIDAAKLYVEIKDDKIESPFSFFPEIGLLWFIQMLLRDSYSYEYFKQALDAIIVKIEESELNIETKIYAIFFTSVIYLELGFEEVFDYLIQNYRSKLPLNLQFALYYEGENIKNKPKRIKKILRQFERKLRELPNNKIEELHKRPIKKIT